MVSKLLILLTFILASCEFNGKCPNPSTRPEGRSCVLSTPPDSTQTLFVNDFSFNTLPSLSAVPITLNYHSTKGNKAISCSVFNVVNFTISRSCECNEDGQCSVEILKGAQATLFGQFSFAVFDGEEVSNPAIFSHRDNSAFSNSFVTLWDISSDNLTLSLPLRSGFLYDFVVDWGGRLRP